MLIYVPLEAYKERYTCQLSAPKTGWLERNWIDQAIPYQRIEGDPSLANKPIKTGCVLDAVKRSKFCFSQIQTLLEMVEEGKITSEDVIYFDDFWTPGIEALPYAFHLFGVQPKMFAYLWAQSVDEFDFTYPMRHWMRNFEKGIGDALTGIFVCGPCLKDLVVQGGIAPKEKVHIVGLPFSVEEVTERLPKWYKHEAAEMKTRPRKNRVVYSSRWDKEKNPIFFLKVATETIKVHRSIQFVICTGAKTIRSNDPELITLLKRACEAYPQNIILRENLTKEQYYEELCQAKVQMNTASQDFVSFTLLEAGVAGCYPIYPYFRSFPETFLHKHEFLYEHLDVRHAVSKLLNVLDRDDLWTINAIEKRKWIHERFDTSWIRMLNHMGLTTLPVTDPYKE